MNIPCFFVEPTGTQRLWYRRFTFSTDGKCPAKEWGHDASTLIGDLPRGEMLDDTQIDKTDIRWPTSCECGYVFQDEDHWQYFTSVLYKRQDTGEVYSLRELPVGGMYYADWMQHKGLDGHSLAVVTPGGIWLVDERCSNCTRPDDHEHYCWVRHGVPPVVTVDKNGNTCAAGAGSIMVGNYHGFLRDGYLVPA